MINKIDKFSTFVQLMIDGLQKRWVRLDMASYGYYDKPDGDGDYVCFGCAATNALCELKGESMSIHDVYTENDRGRFAGISLDHIGSLEMAWNALRMGYVESCLGYLTRIPNLPFEVPTMEKLQGTSYCVPHLTTDYTPQDLMAYQAWANQLRERGL